MCRTNWILFTSAVPSQNSCTDPKFNVKFSKFVFISRETYHLPHGIICCIIYSHASKKKKTSLHQSAYDAPVNLEYRVQLRSSAPCPLDAICLFRLHVINTDRSRHPYNLFAGKLNVPCTISAQWTIIGPQWRGLCAGEP